MEDKLINMDYMMKRIAEGFPGQRQIVVSRDLVQRCRELPVARQLHVAAIGHYPAARNHYIERKNGTPGDILIFCATGAGILRLSQKQWDIQDRQLLLIPPDTPHTYAAAATLPWTIFWLHFTGRLAGEHAKILKLSSQSPVLTLGNSEAWIQQYEKLYTCVANGFSDQALVNSSVMLANLLCLTGDLRVEQHRRGRHSEQRIQSSVEYMTEHHAEHLTLPTLAEQATLSVPQYSALFRRQTGTTPARYLTRIRLRHACERLSYTQEPIAAIAKAVGIEDPLYFSRLFKRHVGHAPSVYRKLSH